MRSNDDNQAKLNWRDPISVTDLEAFRARLTERANDLLRRKGNDYNSQQQLAGDTLFNLRVCEILGIVPSPVDGLLVRMSDKFMRLVSLTRPGAIQAVTDESLEDTLIDLYNYGTYALAMLYKAKRRTPRVQRSNRKGSDTHSARTPGRSK